MLSAMFAMPLLAASGAASAQAADTPRWLKQPSSADIAAVYPRVGARLGHYGRVSLRCAVQPDGGLARCEVLSEDPADEGFADAALKLVRLYKLASPDGAPPPRATIEVPIRFSLAP
jgi:protein TonB